MKATSLLCVFVLAKVLVLVHRDVPLSLWTPVAYLWQDVAGRAAVRGARRLTRRKRPWVGWAVYALLVLYVAVNVPVACTLATPLTWPMLRAARGTLGDSIAHHATAANVSAWPWSWRPPPRCRSC